MGHGSVCHPPDYRINDIAVMSGEEDIAPPSLDGICDVLKELARVWACAVLGCHKTRLRLPH